MSNVEDYKLEKAVWTEDDFETMGWHDARVWGISVNPDERDYLIDLDYIFKWVHPEEGEESFRFWVAPVTLVFENAYGIKLGIESQQGEIEVADLHMGNARELSNGNGIEYTFRFECQEGEIRLSATGYKMYVRKEPRLYQDQSIGYKERGGVNFGRELVSL